MAWDDEAPPTKRVWPELGGDLSALSVSELEDYLSVLAAERQRVEAAIAAKKASGSAAESVFKR
jgi:uncharacterized small protein (DUF1192 family)